MRRLVVALVVCGAGGCGGSGDTTVPDDHDHDGFAAPEDCDDDNPAVSPATVELACNGLDDDCDGKPSDAAICSASGLPLTATDSQVGLTAWLLPDLDGDGLGDVAVRAIGGTPPSDVTWLASGSPSGGNVSDAAYASAAITPTPEVAAPLAVDASSDPGVWVISAYFTSPNGTLSEAQAAASLDRAGVDAAVARAAVDVDGDGHDDAFAEFSFGQESTGVLLSGPFSGVLGPASGPTVAGVSGPATAAGDTDADGHGELLVPVAGAPNLLGAGLAVLATFPLGATATSVGDFDGDGDDDVAVISPDAVAGTALAVVPGPFSGSVALDTAFYATTGAVGVAPAGDVDGDGRGDFFALEGGDATLLLSSDPAPTALPATTPVWRASAGAAATAGDANGALGADAVVGNTLYTDLLY